MSAEFKLKGLETWVYLLDESPIPVLAHTAEKLRNIIGGTREWGLSDVADIICRDPIMTVHLIREANRVFNGKVVGTMTDIHHCVSLLGEGRVLALVKQFKPMKGDPRDTNEIAYQSAIVQSFHAAEQIKAWHKVRKQAAVDKYSLAAKLAGVPSWCLWYSANKEMGIIDTLKRQERIPSAQAEQAVLGCTTQDIINSLAKRWQFPDVILEALDDRHLPSPRFLGAVARRAYDNPEPKIPNKDEHGRIVKTPSFIVSLALWLAREASIDWYSRQTRRVVAIVAGYLEIDMREAWQVVRGAALNVSRSFQFPAIEMPAARLLLPPQPHIRRRIGLSKLNKAVENLSQGKALGSSAEEETKVFVASPQRPTPTVDLGEATKVVKRIAGFVSEDKQRYFSSYMSGLMNQTKVFSSEIELLKKTMEVLKACTYLERVAVLLYDPQQKVLKGFISLGFEDQSIVRKTKVALAPANFFTQLMKKPQGVWVHPERKAEIAALVPGSFKQAMQVDEFIAVSVFNHKRSIGMLYADNGNGGRAGLSESELKIVKSIANATTKYLMNIGRRARKP